MQNPRGNEAHGKDFYLPLLLTLLERPIGIAADALALAIWLGFIGQTIREAGHLGFVFVLWIVSGLAWWWLSCVAQREIRGSLVVNPKGEEKTITGITKGRHRVAKVFRWLIAFVTIVLSIWSIAQAFADENRVEQSTSTDFPKDAYLTSPAPLLEHTPNETVAALSTFLPTPNDSFEVITRSGTNATTQVWVEAGYYIAGDQFGVGFPDELPYHLVYTDGFWIDQFLVTNAKFSRCPRSICGSPQKTGSHSRPNGYWGLEAYQNYPVIEIAWSQANDYCRWRGGRLPTEAEWEKAAGWNPKTGKTLLYPWGNQSPNDSLANFGDIDRDTTPVNSYPLGASPVGAFDMAGNVWQWTADWYSETYYADDRNWTNPKGPTTGTRRVVKGGSWFTASKDAQEITYLRVSNRGQQPPDKYGNEIGFRCVSDEPSPFSVLETLTPLATR